MSPHELGLPVFYLKPGEVYFSEKPALVMTILGSCISVTMYSARHGFGGICHVLLPKCHTESCNTQCSEVYRYADCSIRNMVERFVDMGALRKDIEVKIFGGSDILVIAGHKNYVTVGKQNIEITKKTLMDEGLKIRAAHIGGTFGRKIFFFTHTGEVLMKRIKKSALPAEEICQE